MKILIFQELLPHYRIPVFNSLVELSGYEVTVAHTQHEYVHAPSILFKQLLLQKKQLKSFFFYKQNIHRIASEYDVVIAMFNIRWLSIVKLAFIPNKKYKLIYWGIGVNIFPKFDASQRLDIVRGWLAKRADAMLFYNKYAIAKYHALGISLQKMFVAHNTVKLSPQFLSDDMTQKKSFLYISAIYPHKKVEELIEAFQKALPYFKKSVHIDIVGDGKQRPALEKLVMQLGLQHAVFFHGTINNPELQIPFFRSAFACICPGLSGLSVLQSMAFGVPFVTQANSITGTERLNIIHRVNGILYDEGHQNLANEMIEMVNNPAHTQQMGKNAYEYYTNNCSIENMIGGFINAIKYVSNKHGNPPLLFL